MLPSFKSLIPCKGSFAANVLTLMSGTVIAQGLTVASTPILSRLYSPENFGTLSIFMSITLILSTLASWRYDQAIVLPKREEDAVNLLTISIILALVMSIFLLIGVLFWGRLAVRLLEIPSLKRWLWWIPPCVLIIGIFQALNYWCIRQKQFRGVAVAQICRTAISAASQIGYGLATTPEAGGLIGGYIAGQLMGVLSFAGHAIRRSQKIVVVLSPRQILESMHKYKEIARYSPLTDFMNVISLNVIPLMLNYFFGIAFVGLFMLSHRLISLPSQLVINSLWQTTYSDLSQLNFKEQRSRLRQIHQHTSFIFALPTIAICFFPDRIEALLGEKWRGLGYIIIPLAVMIYMNAVSNSVSYFAVFQRYGEQALANVTLVLLRLGAVIVGGTFFSALGTIYLFAGVSLMIYTVINVRWGIYFADLVHYALNIAMSLMLTLAILFPLKWAINSVPLYTFIAIMGVVFILYYIIVFYFLSVIIRKTTSKAQL